MILFFLPLCASNPYSVDILIYSYNRPLQLYACLESINMYLVGCARITVIYRVSNQQFALGYEQVKNDFPLIQFMQQRKQADDFKRLTLTWLQGAQQYIMFAVDDIVVTDAVDLMRCTQAMEKYNGYGFYLRLGENIVKQQMGKREQKRPPLLRVEEDMYQWTFGDATGGWAYAHTVDMTIYKKDDVHNFFKTAPYKTPNSMEAQWTYHVDKRKRGLCFTHSKIVNIPLNRIQKDYENYAMDISPEQLLVIFNQGLKLDREPLRSLLVTSPHMVYEPTFIER